MNIKYLILFICLSLSAVLDAQPNIKKPSPEVIRINKRVSDSIMKAIRNGRPRRFGNRIMIVGEQYIGDARTWIGSNIMSIETSYPEAIGYWMQTKAQKAYYWRRNSNIGMLSEPFVYRTRSNAMLGVMLNPKFVNFQSRGIRSLGRTYPGFMISDSSAARVFAMGINDKNVANYRYHVLVDDSVEVVPWTKPDLEQKYGALHPYGILGNFSYPGKQAVIEIVDIHNYHDRAGILLDWRPNHDPVVNELTGYAYNMTFSLNDTKRGYATKIDPQTRLPLNLTFPAHSINKLTFRFDDHEDVFYSAYLRRDTAGDLPRSLKRFSITGNEFVFDDDILNMPGSYQLVIKSGYYGQGIGEVTVPFKVLPPIPQDEEAYTTKEIYRYAGAVSITIVLAFAGYYIYNKRKLKKAEQQKSLANLKLNSVRSQLNPHFMFNALTSIQNLMNQQDTEGANHYLSKFAGLTRQVLKTSGQELVSLEDEIKLMTDYLQMEQLRFGFAYDINVDTNINQANTDIPNMLLQPFIENAAKYGVSALQSKGKITLNISKQQSDLVLSVADNGPGFSTANSIEGNGMGIKLSKERIDLLNQIYKDQPITLTIDNTANGVTITITLTDWL